MSEVTVVVSQSMFFPWPGFLEQMALADIFVYYDDVQMIRKSFTRRVQIKTDAGSRWLTVPLVDFHQGQLIDQILTHPAAEWHQLHLSTLATAYRNAPYRDSMLQLAQGVLEAGGVSLSQLGRSSMHALASYFGVASDCEFIDSRELGIGGRSTQRLRDIVTAVGGTVYLTGFGARNYLEHELFEDAGVDVQYMQYSLTQYPQLHGAFNPYVSALDLVANLGPAGASAIKGSTTPWRVFVAQVND